MTRISDGKYDGHADNGKVNRDYVGAFVGKHIGLVSMMAQRFHSTNLDLDFHDLISEGNEALMRCAEKYDPTRGVKPSSYICSVILNSFLTLARNHRNKNSYLRFGNTGRLFDIHPYFDKLDKHINEGFIGGMVSEALSICDERQRDMIEARFGFGGYKWPQSLETIAMRHGIKHRQQVEQILGKAMRELAKHPSIKKAARDVGLIA